MISIDELQYIIFGVGLLVALAFIRLAYINLRSTERVDWANVIRYVGMTILVLTMFYNMTSTTTLDIIDDIIGITFTVSLLIFLFKAFEYGYKWKQDQEEKELLR